MGIWPTASLAGLVPGGFMRARMEGTGAQMASGGESDRSSHILGCLPSPGRLEHPSLHSRQEGSRRTGSHLVTGQSPQPPNMGTGTIWAFGDFTWLAADFDFKVLWSGNRTKEKGSCREREARAPPLPTPPRGVERSRWAGQRPRRPRRVAEPGKPASARGQLLTALRG